MARGRGGRPSKAKPERLAQLVGLLRFGVHRSIAATAVGIGASTLRRWMAQGRKDLERAEKTGEDLTSLAEFARLVETVEAQAEAGIHVSIVRLALQQGDVAALQRYAARRYPQRFGRYAERETDLDNAEEFERAKREAEADLLGADPECLEEVIGDEH